MWPFSPLACDIYLCIDYTVSNASVANLIIISLDRYLSGHSRKIDQKFNPVVNPSVPRSLICVGSRWRQIDAFRLLRRDCARLRRHRMSLIVSKRRAFCLCVIYSWSKSHVNCKLNSLHKPIIIFRTFIWT